MIWTPAWGTSNEGQALLNTPENRDPRERVWYFDDLTFANAMGAWATGSAPVYDLLAVYPPGQAWDTATDTPGQPAWSVRNGFQVTTLEAQALPLLPACSSVTGP